MHFASFSRPGFDLRLTISVDLWLLFSIRLWLPISIDLGLPIYIDVRLPSSIDIPYFIHEYVGSLICKGSISNALLLSFPQTESLNHRCYKPKDFLCCIIPSFYTWLQLSTLQSCEVLRYLWKSNSQFTWRNLHKTQLGDEVSGKHVINRILLQRLFMSTLSCHRLTRFHSTAMEA